MKLAVFFPGIGYTNDKPLIYYARKIARNHEYEEVCVEYHDLPAKVRGNKELMMQAVEMAYKQACERLSTVDFTAYDEVLMVGKSIGTVLATRYCSEHNIKARLVLYTPVEATFEVPVTKDAIAFIGDEDPWSSLDEVKHLAQKCETELIIYPGCNHSLECGEAHKDINTLKEVMNATDDFLRCNVFF